MNGKQWTADELATLYAQYPHMNTSALAGQLNRSAAVVRYKANSLGLTKAVDFNPKRGTDSEPRGDAAMSFADIASSMGITTTGVHHIYRRAIRKVIAALHQRGVVSAQQACPE